MAETCAKKRRLGARVSPGQFALLLDYLAANPALVRAATDSPLTKEERYALWDTVVSELNAQGPAIKSRAEWKAHWNGRVCAARRRDSDISCATRQTGGGVNPIPPLNAEEERFLALVGTDSSNGCWGRRVGVAPMVGVPAAADPSPADEGEAAPESPPPVPAPTAQVAAPPQPSVHQPPGALPPRVVRVRSGPECTTRDLLATQKEQLAAQLDLLATQQGLLATQREQLAAQLDLVATQQLQLDALQQIIELRRGTQEAIRGLMIAVEGLAAASTQQSSSLTTLILHLMGVRNLQPPQ
ncbi:unnamed protein product [Ixodes pacificus]